MPLKKSRGNMYDWVTHTHSHLAGECPHKCSYCYVQRNRFGVSPRYQGPPRLIKPELRISYGIDKIIFIEHMGDLFAEGIPEEWIRKILLHCQEWPDNTYVFQTKHPARAFYLLRYFPKKFIFGTTIETNRNIRRISGAPDPISRFYGLNRFADFKHKTFITIEPIMDFDECLVDWIIDTKPTFVNIGADSKGCKLKEPPKEKIIKLINILVKNKIEIRKKVNLKRLGI